MSVRPPIEISRQKSLDLFAEWILERKISGVIIYADDPSAEITQHLIRKGVWRQRLRPSCLTNINIRNVNSINCTTYDYAVTCDEQIAAIWLEYDCGIEGDEEYSPAEDLRSLIKNPQIQPDLVIALTLRAEQNSFSQVARVYTTILNNSLRVLYDQKYKLCLSENFRNGDQMIRFIRWADTNTLDDPQGEPPNKRQRLTKDEPIKSWEELYGKDLVEAGKDLKQLRVNNEINEIVQKAIGQQNKELMTAISKNNEDMKRIKKNHELLSGELAKLLKEIKGIKKK